MKIYINGQLREKEDAMVSVFDHGLLYGDGVFEGIRVYGGRVFRLDDHLQRLAKSAESILLTLPMPLKKIEAAVLETVRANGLKDAYIRLLLTRGVGDLGLDMRKCKAGPCLIIIADRIELYPDAYYEKGLDLIVSTIRQRRSDQLSPGVKSLNYLPNVLARAEASRAGAQEAILLSTDGYVTECSGDNIFFIAEGAIVTPPVHIGILEGVTRKVVMELCRDRLGNPVVERLFTPFELYRAGEVFLTGSGAEIIPAVRIDGRTIGSGAAGPMTKKIIGLFRDYAASPASGTAVYEDAKR
ncbi:MAG: branched-chain-amino-acid transaminase [Elusimicrobia bacterium]|nr:branched-chain-amino-acid transaminase [Elusimicrobiota bacterium]